MTRKQNNHDKKKFKTVTRKENKNRTGKDFQAPKMVRNKVVMMCWVNLEESLEEETNKEMSGEDERLDVDKEK